MKERIDAMFRKWQGRLLEEIISYLERLGVTIAFMAGSAAVIKFRGSVLPDAPCIAGAVGFILLIAAFFLLAAVTLDGWVRLLNIRGYTWPNHAYGFLLLVPSVFFVIAGYYAAFSP